MTMPIIDIPAGITAEQAALFTTQQAFAAQQEQLRNQLAAAVAAVWAVSTASGVFGLPAVRKFVDQIMPLALGSQRAMAAMTVAQLNRDARLRKPIQIPLDRVTGSALRGKDPSAYYERPFREVLWRLSQGKELPQALAAGLRRAESLTQTDLQLAHTRTAQAFLHEYDLRQPEPIDLTDLPPLGDPAPADRPSGGTPERETPEAAQTTQIVGYRRVLSNRPNHCALCVLASTQRYRKAELMPIHPGCGCTVRPVFETEWRADKRVLDPSLAQDIHNIIRRDLGEKYVDANARDGEVHYRDIVVTNNHGEIGPILGVRGQHFERDPNRPGHLGRNYEVNPVDLDDL